MLMKSLVCYVVAYYTLFINTRFVCLFISWMWFVLLPQFEANGGYTMCCIGQKKRANDDYLDIENSIRSGNEFN